MSWGSGWQQSAPARDALASGAPLLGSPDCMLRQEGWARAQGAGCAEKGAGSGMGAVTQMQKGSSGRSPRARSSCQGQHGDPA